MLRYQHYEYENGLQVVTKQENYKKACILLGLRAGSYYEDSSSSGASHFIEHLLFQTPARGAKRKYLENIVWNGIHANAFTHVETMYAVFECFSRRTDSALEGLFNAVSSKKFLPEDFLAEQGNVLREIGEYYDDPGTYLHDGIFFPTIYRGTPLQKNLLGTKEVINTFTPESLLACKQKFFYPENMILVVVGNFNERKVFEKIKETFATLKATGKKAPLPAPFHPLPFPLRVEESRPGISETYLHIGCLTPGYGHEDYIPLQFLKSLLGADYTSRLYYELGIEKGLTYDVGTELEINPFVGVLSSYATIAPEKEKEVLTRIRKIYRTISTQKIKKSELEGVKNMMLSKIPELEEGALELFQHVVYNKEYDLLSEAYQKRIKSITAEEVLATAQKYLRKKQLTAILRPG